MSPGAPELAERALARVRGGSAQVTVTVERSLMLRFARSRPTQATAVDDLTLEVTAFRDGQLGSATTNRTCGEALDAVAGAAVSAAEAAARSAGSGSHPGLPPSAPTRTHDGHDPETALLDPAPGGAALEAAFRVAAAHGVEAHGIWTAAEVETAIASSTGIAARDRVTDAFMKVTAIAPGGRSGYDARTAVAAGALDADAIAARAVLKALGVGAPDAEALEAARAAGGGGHAGRAGAAGFRPAHRRTSRTRPYRGGSGTFDEGVLPGTLGEGVLPRTLGERVLPPGEYPVVLEPHAVGELLSWLGWAAFNGLAYAEERSALCGRLGTRVAAPCVALADSPSFPGTLPRAFDAEGVPKAPLPLIQDGVAHRVVHDTRSGALAGAASTGHALAPGGSPYGPLPTNLVLLGGGAAGEAELCQPIERGVYVTRFWYVNPVRPAETHMTGVTRDGTFLIEDGEVTRPLADLRFSDSLLGVLERTQALGSRPRLSSDGELYGRRFATGVVCPPLRASALRFTA